MCILMLKGLGLASKVQALALKVQALATSMTGINAHCTRFETFLVIYGPIG